MSDPHADLIRALAHDLEPVRPIPSLRAAVAGVVVVWLGVAAVVVGALGPRPDAAAMVLAPLGPGGVLLGLVLAGLGGVVAAVSLGVPGREASARAGLLAGLAGLAWAAGVGTALVVAQAGGAGAATTVVAGVRGDLTCLALAGALAVLPGLGIVAFAARAAPFRPLALAIAAAAATAALGAAAAQTSCPYHEARHLLVAHALAPAVGAVVLALPLLLALRRLGRGA